MNRMVTSLALGLALALGSSAFAEEKKPAADAKAAAAEAKADAKAAAPELSEAEERTKASYIFGTMLGKNFHEQGFDLDTDALVEGIKEANAEKAPKYSEEEMQKFMQSFGMKAAERAKAKRDVAGKKNLEDAKKFLAENGKKDGVKTTKSGLQYKVIKEGSGKSPAATDTVKVHYRGTLISGKEFDSSYKRNEPTEFPVNRVIPGWTEALQLMKVGSKYELYIPPDLAYGENGPGEIGSNSLLKFEVELLDVVSKDAPKDAAPKLELKK